MEKNYTLMAKGIPELNHVNTVAKLRDEAYWENIAPNSPLSMETIFGDS